MVIELSKKLVNHLIGSTCPQSDDSVARPTGCVHCGDDWTNRAACLPRRGEQAIGAYESTLPTCRHPPARHPKERHMV